MTENDNGIIEPNDLKYLSYSQMSTYMQCGKLWAYNYIHKAPRTDTVFTMFGSIIHETLEYIVNNPEHRTLAKATEIYNSMWQEFKLTDVSFYERGLEMLEKYLDRPNVFQYHTLGTEIQFGQDKHGNGTPMFIGNVPVLGFIDKVELVDECTIVIRDYKTNLMMFSNDEVKTHMQMSMYDIIARQLFPWATNVILMLDQPGHTEFPSERTDEQRAITTAFIQNIWQQMLYDKTHGENLNQYCRYCPLRSGCCTYQIALVEKTAIANSIDAIGLWEEKEILVNQKKAVEGRIMEIETAIKDMMAHGGSSKMIVGDSEFYFSQQRRKEYPMNKVIEIAESMNMHEVVKDCTKFEKTRFEKHPQVKGNKVLMSLIDKQAIVSFTKPSLSCRKTTKI